MISGLLAQVNAFRAANGLAPLQLTVAGTNDADIRAIQFSAYMASHAPGSPGFNPHEGYDTTAASLGYNVISENLAYLTSDPGYIVYGVWQDRLHLAAMLAPDANVAGVSCVFSEGTPYWSFEPGISAAVGGSAPSTPAPGPAPNPTPTPTPAPAPTPSPTPAAGSLDTEEAQFLTLINNFRAQSGVGPLKISSALESASRWMSSDMASKNYGSHTDSLGRGTDARLAAFGYPYSPWAENIAGGSPDAQSVFNQWASYCDPDPSGQCTYAHRRNMLSSAFLAIGIARAYSDSSNYGWYWTTDFGGVEDGGSGSGGVTLVQPPRILSLEATPASIAPGQSTTLAWGVQDASALSIDNGVGTVFGTSVQVAPSQSTVYTLTASNSAGTVTAKLTVTVQGSSADSQPPTVPSLVRAAATSPTSVDLSWSASADNVGVTRYIIYRNNSAFASVPGDTLAYSDTSAAAGTTYSYTVSAADAANNTSPASAEAVVTTTADTANTGCPPPSTGAFTACYYPNTTLTGAPRLIRIDPRIDFDWGAGSPDASLEPRNFSARWQGNIGFDEGNYTFTAITSDGMRVYLDGQKVLDAWRDQPPYMYVVQRAVSQGNHLITVESYERSGGAAASLTWEKR
jgi:uncharacterized protein YkwD